MAVRTAVMLIGMMALVACATPDPVAETPPETAVTNVDKDPLEFQGRELMFILFGFAVVGAAAL